MSHAQIDIFSGSTTARLQMTESIELTIQSLQAYGPEHDHWGIAWSGGKDSSATLTLIIHLIDTDRIGRPRISLINIEEEARIRELLAAGQWPDGWDGDEPVADQPLEITYYQDGAEQPSLFGGALHG